MRFEAKHVVTMVVAASAAVILGPVSVRAATGQIVNIADPFNATHVARVNAAGTLAVETRAGATANSFNMTVNSVTDLGLHKMVETGAPNRLAITEFTVATRGTDNGYTTQVDLRAWVRTNGTNACGGVGWTSKLLRRFSVKTNETVQLVFDGPPMILPTPAAGQRICLTAAVSLLPNGVVVEFGGTGYQYV